MELPPPKGRPLEPFGRGNWPLIREHALPQSPYGLGRHVGAAWAATRSIGPDFFQIKNWAQISPYFSPFRPSWPLSLSLSRWLDTNQVAPPIFRIGQTLATRTDLCNFLPIGRVAPYQRAGDEHKCGASERVSLGGAALCR